MNRRSILNAATGLKNTLLFLVPLLIGLAAGVYLGSIYTLSNGSVAEEGADWVANSPYHVDVLGIVESVSSSRVSIRSCEYSTKGETLVFVLKKRWTHYETDLLVGKHVHISYLIPESGDLHTVHYVNDAEPCLQLIGEQSCGAL